MAVLLRAAGAVFPNFSCRGLLNGDVIGAILVYFVKKKKMPDSSGHTRSTVILLLKAATERRKVKDLSRLHSVYTVGTLTS